MKKDHLEVLLEDVASKLDSITEGISALQNRGEFNHLSLSEDVADIKDILDAVRDATTAHGSDLRAHDARLSDIEEALAT